FKQKHPQSRPILLRRQQKSLNQWHLYGIHFALIPLHRIDRYLMFFPRIVLRWTTLFSRTLY
ncbi:MAG: hypothetical protein WCL71_14005, partial [Deltaproteobacteria bacterium]